MAIELNSKNFEEVVLKANVPVLVDFWASWCGPCRMMAPIVDELSNEANDAYVVGKVDIDAEPDLASKYGIRNIPTFVVFKDGVEVAREVGMRSKEALQNLVVDK
ncbi:MAG TPA: thioredoxin [Clostridiales bacterium]|jgi:thioredoxin 1|nr:thioredoxin [Clostridiales bacterium]